MESVRLQGCHVLTTRHRQVAALADHAHSVSKSRQFADCTALARYSVRHEHMLKPCRYTTSHQHTYIQHEESLEPLQRILSPQQYEDMLSKHPELVTCQIRSPVTSWVEFLGAYGLDQQSISKLLVQCPDMVAGSSIYEAGRTILFLRHLGWRNEQIRDRIFAQYPQVLGKQLERDIQPVIQELLELGCTSHDIRLLVWEYPRIFTAGRDYKRHIRKFQYLGLYGLKLPQQSSSACSSSSSSKGHASATYVEGSWQEARAAGTSAKMGSLEWLLMMVQN